MLRTCTESLFLLWLTNVIFFSSGTDMCDPERNEELYSLASPPQGLSGELNCPPRVAPGLNGWSEMGSWFKQGKSVFSEILVYVPIIKSCEDDSGFHRKEPACEGNQMSQEYQWEEQEKVLKLFALHWLPTRTRQDTPALPPPTPILKSIFLIH